MAPERNEKFLLQPSSELLNHHVRTLEAQKRRKPCWARGDQSHDGPTKSIMAHYEMVAVDANTAEEAQQRQLDPSATQPTIIGGKLIWKDPITPLIYNKGAARPAP